MSERVINTWFVVGLSFVMCFRNVERFVSLGEDIKNMVEICLEFSLCFAFLYLLEGIETALTENANRIYKIMHIICPLFMVITIFYISINGFVR